MRYCSVGCLLLGLVALALLGCKPTPVVIEHRPDAVKSDIDVHNDVDRAPTSAAPATGTGVDVRVGGGQGVDVKVGPNRHDAKPSAK